MPQRTLLTKKIVESLPVPKRGRTYVYDSRVPSLAVCVTANGARTWYRCGKIKGRPSRIRIGVVAEISVENARTIAANLSLQVASGANPHVERASGKTLEAIWLWYLEHHAKPRKRSWERDVQRWEQHLKQWGRRSAASITRQQIVELHNQLRDSHGPSAANRTIWMVRHMFSLAIRNEWVKANPATAIKAFVTNSRERFLSADELRRFMDALDTLAHPLAKDAFLMLLWTGARRSNVLSMRWDEINFDTKVWTIPAAKSKNAKPMSVILSEPAIEILQSRPRTSEWVFPSHSAAGHYTWPKGAWQRVMQAAQLHDFRIHDLRRTFGSWQAASGASLHVIGKSLGHTSTASTSVYARLDLDPVRRSVEAATAAMKKATEKK